MFDFDCILISSKFRTKLNNKKVNPFQRLIVNDFILLKLLSYIESLDNFNFYFSESIDNEKMQSTSLHLNKTHMTNLICQIQLCYKKPQKS